MRTTRQRSRRVAMALGLVAGACGFTGAALVGCGGGDDTSAGPGTDASMQLDGFPLPVGLDGGSGDAAPARGCGPNGTVTTAPTYDFIGPDAGGCNVAQIDALSVDCLESNGSDAAATACSTFLDSTANVACLTCIYGASLGRGPSGDAPDLQRPLYTVDFPTGSTDGIVFASVGGCIAANAPKETACAQAVAAATACETEQCSGCGLDLDAGSPPAGDASADAASDAASDAATVVVPVNKYDQINACIAAASVGPCADLETQSLDCTTRLFAADAGPVRTCGDLVSSASGTLTADLTSYLFVACGGGPETPDGGAADAGDAGKDGSK